MTNSAFDPASRVRFIQFIPYLQQAGWTIEHRPNRPDRQWSSSLPGRIPRAVHHRLSRGVMLVNRLRDIEAARRFDVIFVNRDLGGKLFLERRLLRGNPRVVFDFDDAIFLGKGERTARWMCEHAAWVTPGNEYLAAWARRFSDRVTVLPTVIDTDKYRCSPAPDDRASSRIVRVGWSGSDQSITHSLFPYLPMLADAQKTIPFELVIVTNTQPTLPCADLRWRFIPWSAATEGEISSHFDIGIMPLKDDEFQRGKCGLKLLQYMAAALPTIASPVGVNSGITLHGKTGLLARTDAEWRDFLGQLIFSSRLRQTMGKAGKERCEQFYSIRRWSSTLATILETVALTRQSERCAAVSHA